MLELRQACILAVALACLGCSRPGTGASSRAVAQDAAAAVPVLGPADSCPADLSRSVHASIDTSRTLRAPIPREIYGFNVPGHDFNLAFLRNGSVRPEVVDWLKPFAGALYRYPPGTPSNWMQWREAIGPRDKRATQYDNYGIREPVAFGYPEFFSFLSRVQGRALLSVNVAGYHEEPKSASFMAGETLALMRWVASPAGAGCATGPSCPVAFWEFGNELDWPPFNWDARTYAQRINEVVSTVESAMPGINWVAHGQTAPWDAQQTARAPRFDAELSALTDKRVEFAAFHAYYDGYTVPDVLGIADRLVDTWGRGRRQAHGVISEHGRWPNQQEGQKWEDSWPEAINLSGALSTADFQLAMLPDERIAASNLHTMAVRGPWQLFLWDPADDSLRPSPVYWALRTLREATLDRAMQITPATPESKGYAAGYELRLVATASGAAAQPAMASVLGVNRSPQPIRLTLSWSSWKPALGQADMRWVSGQPEDHNLPPTSDRVTMRTTASQTTGTGESIWCIPAHSVFSIMQR